MPVPTQAEIERKVRVAIERSDHRDAATQALQGFGHEVLRFLRARLRDSSQAEEAYQQFSEDLWVGLPAFRWESSLRIWMFVLARNAATRVSKNRPREVELKTGWPYSQLCAGPRTETAPFMQTAMKERIREIRRRLEEDEQTLLILRIDRQLEWRELAIVMNEVGGDASEAEQQRASARLRARFQAAKKRLRNLAEAEGLLPPSSDSSGRSQ